MGYFAVPPHSFKVVDGQQSREANGIIHSAVELTCVR